MNSKQVRANRRKLRQREKIRGTNTKPRLTVFRSNKYLYVQLIDDKKGKTLCGLSQQHIQERKDTKRLNLAKELGIMLAQKAKEQKIEKVVFDKGPYAYHGLVKAIADGAREGGLTF